MNLEFSLTITNSAKEQIIKLIKESQISEPIPAIVWTTNPNNGVSEWMIGFYCRKNIPEDSIIEIGSLDFIIEHHWRNALNGKQLDLFKGSFIIN